MHKGDTLTASDRAAQVSHCAACGRTHAVQIRSCGPPHSAQRRHRCQSVFPLLPVKLWRLLR